MLVHLDDILTSCPLLPWVARRESISIELPGGHHLVVRLNLTDLGGTFATLLTVDELRNFGGSLLAHKEDYVLDALRDCLVARVRDLLEREVRLTEFVNALLEDFTNSLKSTGIDKQEKAIVLIAQYTVLQDIKLMLEEYGERATLAGWPRFIRLCEAFLLQS